MNILLGPAHFGNVDKTFNAWFQFNKCTIFGDVGDRTVELGANRIFFGRAVPWIAFQLFHAKRDTLGVLVDLDDLDFQRVADVDHLVRVIDPLVGQIGNMQ